VRRGFFLRRPELAGEDTLGVVERLIFTCVATALSGTTQTAIADFVMAGGNLVIAGTASGVPNHDTAFLNDVFGYALVDDPWCRVSSVEADKSRAQGSGSA